MMEEAVTLKTESQKLRTELKSHKLEGKVYIVGIGPGSKKYILPEAIEVMENSDTIIGFKRAIESIDFVKSSKGQVDSLKETLSFIEDNKEKVIAIIASGDPCFYGIADYIGKNYSGEIEIIPGISSFQYFFAKLKKSWQGAFLGSLHGREEDFIKIVKSESISFWLTDKKNTPSFIAKKLIEEGIEATIHIGENLSYEDERIISSDLEEVAYMDFSELSVIIIERR
jgi:cobalt-precorrin-7 (C5)-methyltransferase